MRAIRNEGESHHANSRSIRGPDERDGWVAYDFAVLRAVPHPHTGAFVPVGVVVHARTVDFLQLATLTDRRALANLLPPDSDIELLGRYLDACRAICAGQEDAGPVALAPPPERFSWITAPRSDVIQCGPVHEGLCESPEAALHLLFEQYVQGEERGRGPAGHQPMP